jgi:hypothetical protein
MATFSLGTSGVTPGAPGVYINEQAGRAANANLASFSTVYMLVETDEDVPVTKFPFNTPIAITSLNDYKELIKVGNSTTPSGRISLLSYNCVNEFFQNAQVGDLRVVRVGTPNQIVEVELFPSSTKINSTSLPSSLIAGNVVYVQMIINGIRLVSGVEDTFNAEHPGFTADNEWLGVPVEIPVNYVAGDEANNRKISAAMSAAVAAAIESNPAVRSSVYVRDFGLTIDREPLTNSETGYVTFAATTFDGNVSVVTEVKPVGSNFVFMQNAYDIGNIVGQQNDLERVPQDYTQCIATAFDGQQDQGYLITPTAYAQFDAEGRALVGAAAAAHCENNNYKWMALADPGPFLVTDINKYENFTEHQPAADLVEGKEYLVNNVIYKWIGTDVSYARATYQSIVFGQSPETAVNESANLVVNGSELGLLDSAKYTISAVSTANDGVFELTSSNYWPVTLPVQEVVLSGAGTLNNFASAYVRGNTTSAALATGPAFGTGTYTTVGGPLTNGVYTGITTTGGTGTGAIATVTVTGGNVTNVVLTSGGTGYTVGDTLTLNSGVPLNSTFVVTSVDLPVNLNGTVYVIAGPYDAVNDSEYSLNRVLLAINPVDASNLYNQVILAGGSVNVTYPLIGSAYIASPSGDTAQIAYADPKWNKVVTINGQQSDLIENISGANAGVNTLHLPGTLQNPTAEYILNWVSRTLLNPSSQISASSGITGVTDGSALFTVISHGLRSGERIYFTQPVTVTVGSSTSDLVSATTKLVSRPYWVKVLSTDTFVVSNSLANYTTSAYVPIPTGGTLSTTPSIFYGQVLGRGLTTVNAIELLTLPMVRGRKFQFDTNTIWNQALDASLAPTSAPVAGNPGTSIYLNNSAVVLGEDQITPYGEDLSSPSLCGWLPKFNLVDPDPTPVNKILNAYCSPTVDQFFQAEAFFVPAIDSILVGTYDGTAGSGTIGPVSTVSVVAGAAGTKPDATYNNIPVSGGAGSGLTISFTVVLGVPTAPVVNNPGQGYLNTDSGLTLPADFGGSTISVALLNTTGGSATISTTAGTYGAALAPARLVTGATGSQLVAQQAFLVGTYLDVTTAGVAPDGTTAVVIGDRIAFTYDGSTYKWTVVPAATKGGDLTAYGQPCYNSQVELTFEPEEAVPSTLWRFDAITSTEIIDNALRGVGFNGVPQAEFIEAGIDNVNRLFDDSQRYSNPFGFIAYYGPWIENGAGQYIPPSPYVTGVAVRRYRAEGYQFPPAGVKYQLADAVAAQIPINSAQQNLLNPKGCNAVRTLPGYPQSAVFIWGGRTRLGNPDDAQQKLYQFVNTRVILNVVYGSLRSAFDSQIFNVIDGFGVIFNQIISVGNSILNQLYVRGALFGARPSDAFQVICDSRINPPEDIENGIVNAKIFVTPVPTLERIQIDLIRVAIGKMQEELDIQGLGQSNQ